MVDQDPLPSLTPHKEVILFVESVELTCLCLNKKKKKEMQERIWTHLYANSLADNSLQKCNIQDSQTVTTAPFDCIFSLFVVFCAAKCTRVLHEHAVRALKTLQGKIFLFCDP